METLNIRLLNKHYACWRWKKVMIVDKNGEKRLEFTKNCKVGDKIQVIDNNRWVDAKIFM